ncbi:MAG: hypothetical protein GX593_13190 [Actinomycetales bacterium]|nr:hypothetical protein [Actinomycetales bacterium]
MTINVNGQQYASWAHVPPEIRARLAHLPDKNRDGIPDVLQGDTSGLGPGTTFETTTFSVNGVQYDSLDDLPQALRAEWERALSALGGGSSGGQGPATHAGWTSSSAASAPSPSPAWQAPPPSGPPGPSGPPSSGYAPARTPSSARSRPTMMNGQPYVPDAARKRWWQFWK